MLKVEVERRLDQAPYWRVEGAVLIPGDPPRLLFEDGELRSAEGTRWWIDREPTIPAEPGWYVLVAYVRDDGSIELERAPTIAWRPAADRFTHGGATVVHYDDAGRRWPVDIDYIDELQNAHMLGFFHREHRPEKEEETRALLARIGHGAFP